ncbi:MAG: radical SAM/SPASM domain-containing protein [Syntrophobacteraceae bacterium]
MGPRDNSKIALPVWLYIEVTNRCNLRCRTCVQYRGMKEAPGDLSLEEVRWIAGQVPGLKRAVLHGIGEPLLNEELPQIIRSLKDRGVYVLFNSNALLLSPELAEEMVASGLDEFRVSLDAATESTYARVRATESLHRVLNNLEVLIRKRQEGRRSGPIISAWMVGTQENVRDLPEMILLASRLGIDEVYLQRLVYPLDGPKHGLAAREAAIVDSSEEINEIIARGMSLSRRLGVRFVASGLAAPSESLRLKSRDEAPWRQCRRPWEVAYITAWGNVLPCCISPFSLLDYNSLVMGNVFQQGLERIWKGERFREFREKHQSADPPGCCAGCGIQWSL